MDIKQFSSERSFGEGGGKIFCVEDNPQVSVSYWWISPRGRVLLDGFILERELSEEELFQGVEFSKEELPKTEFS